MASVMICEPSELYNILNQYTHLPRLAEINYLCLIDARERELYNASHVITAKHVKKDAKGTFLVPEGVEVESLRCIVVYDCDTSTLEGSGEAVQCAGVLAKTSLHPVCVVKGGYQKFSALYPFFRSVKIMYTIIELGNFEPYPVEMIAGLLYMGDHRQATSPTILEDLKTKALVNVSESSSLELENENLTILDVCIADSATADMYSNLQKICDFIGSHLKVGSCVLIFSHHGISRSSAVTIAFLMHHLKSSLKDAWNNMLKCKANMRPNRGFVQQLSDWELHTLGTRSTDISEPYY